MKRKIISCLLIASLCTSLCSCTRHEGIITGKKIVEAHEEIILIPVGKVTIPCKVNHDDSFHITIETDTEKEKTWQVNQECFDAYSVGDEFEFNRKTCGKRSDYERETK